MKKVSGLKSSIEHPPLAEAGGDLEAMGDHRIVPAHFQPLAVGNLRISQIVPDKVPPMADVELDLALTERVENDVDPEWG